MRHLAARYGARVIGLTVSAAQHAYASRRGESRDARVDLGDWLANGLPAASADAVIAIESTEHMADLPLALAEMRRVLRPGGRIGVCVWLAADAVASWHRRVLLDPIAREGRLVTLTTVDRSAALLRRAGFEAIRFEDLTASVRRTWTVCLRRLARRAATDPRYLRYAFGRGNGERVFVGAMLRILTAYATGAMRYGLFTARAAGAPQAADSQEL